MEKKRTCRWATIGCGTIAHEMAQALQRLGRGFCAAAGRTPQKVRAFAAEFGIEKAYDTPAALFADPDIDIVYISTPHNTHAPYIMQALSAGKHVLAEKAITLNAHELAAAASLAEEKGLVLAEAMTIYHMPLYRALASRIEAGEFGALRLAQLSFGSYKPYDMENRFFNLRLAGGALLDIGVYALSCARFFLAENPEEIVSRARLAPSGVDEQAVIVLKNSVEEMAAITLSLHAKQPKRAVFSFDGAYIEICDYPRADRASIIWAADGRREDIVAGETEKALDYEVLAMERAVRGEGNEMRFDYTRGVMEIMTKLREAWGVKYPEEEAAAERS